MRLLISQYGVDMEFVEPRTAGAYPWLTKVGHLLLAARAGHLESVGIAESANMSFDIDNANRQASTLLGRPIRARAVIYDDAGDEFFSGLVQQIIYGNTLSGTIEA